MMCEDTSESGNRPGSEALQRTWILREYYLKLKKLWRELGEDIRNFDKTNSSETKVLEANHFSAYKGHLVLRINVVRSGSFGIMVVKKRLKLNREGRNEVRHEYGHTKQLKMLGPIKYLIFIGIPSIRNQWGDNYYSHPVEVTADLFGEATRWHLPGAEEEGLRYLYKVYKLWRYWD